MDRLDVKKNENTVLSDYYLLDAQRSNVGDSFLLFFQDMLYVTFYGRVSFACFS